MEKKSMKKPSSERKLQQFETMGKVNFNRFLLIQRSSGNKNNIKRKMMNQGTWKSTLWNLTRSGLGLIEL